MNINVLSGVNFASLCKISNKYATNPINFKGLKQDTFEKQPTQRTSVQEQAKILKELEDKIEKTKTEILELKKELRKQRGSEKYYSLSAEIDTKERELSILKRTREEKWSQYNPNIAFLYDESTSWSQKRKELAQHDEIVPLSQINKIDDCTFSNIYRSGKYFVINKTNIGGFLDTSSDVNSINFDKLQTEGLYSFSEISDEYGFSQKDINRYIKSGLLKPLELTNIQTEEKEAVHILDMSDEENVNGIERYEELKNLIIADPNKNNDWLSTDYLVAQGYGSKDEIIKQIKYRKLPGRIVAEETPEGKIENGYVYLKHPRTEGCLQYLRNQNKSIVNLEQFAKLAKIDTTELEDAILSGKVEYMPTYIFQSDKGKVLINLKSPKNVRFINKKNFEYEIIQEQIKSQRKEKASLRAKIAWVLCPKTRQVAKSICAQNPEYRAIFEKIDKIKDYEEREAKGKLEENEVEPYLTRDERIKLKTFYKTLWHNSGTEEYKEAMAQAKAIIEQYKALGINSIENEEVRNCIKENCQNK